jgi:hypothetical protein
MRQVMHEMSHIIFFACSSLFSPCIYLISFASSRSMENKIPRIKLLDIQKKIEMKVMPSASALK